MGRVRVMWDLEESNLLDADIRKQRSFTEPVINLCWLKVLSTCTMMFTWRVIVYANDIGSHSAIPRNSFFV